MAEESTFFKQAAEAIVATSLNISNVDPTIKELLKRIKSNGIDFNRIAEPSNATETLPSSQNIHNTQLDVQQVPKIHNNNATVIPSNVLKSNIALNNSHSPQESVSLIPSESSVNGRLKFAKEDILSTESVFSSFMDSNDNNEKELIAISPESNATKIKAKDKSLNKLEKKYPCSLCDLVFFRSSDLRRHEKAHSLILPHICSRCGKGFARKDALKRHFNTLTCDRNRKKLIEITNGKIDEFLERAKKEGISL